MDSCVVITDYIQAISTTYSIDGMELMDVLNNIAKDCTPSGNLCSATTLKKKPCSKRATIGSFCRMHSVKEEIVNGK